MSKNTGGPAFPVHDPFAAHQPGTVDLAQRLAEGMTLRDYFATKAMATLIAEADDDLRWWLDDHGEGLMSTTALARASYVIADAMLAERAA